MALHMLADTDTRDAMSGAARARVCDEGLNGWLTGEVSAARSFAIPSEICQELYSCSSTPAILSSCQYSPAFLCRRCAGETTLSAQCTRVPVRERATACQS